MQSLNLKSAYTSEASLFAPFALLHSKNMDIAHPNVQCRTCNSETHKVKRAPFTNFIGQVRLEDDVDTPQFKAAMKRRGHVDFFGYEEFEKWLNTRNKQHARFKEDEKWLPWLLNDYNLVPMNEVHIPYLQYMETLTTVLAKAVYCGLKIPKQCIAFIELTTSHNIISGGIFICEGEIVIRGITEERTFVDKRFYF